MDRNIHNVTATGFTPIPTTPLACPALVIASTDDKYMTSDRSAVFAKMWEADFKLLPGHGHINAASNIGDWVDGQRLVYRFLFEQGLLK
jgi:predicted alpha/beta hydrolase family esterase